MKEKRKNKKAQLSIFIIIAVIIVIVLLVLLLFGNNIRTWVSPTGSQEYIKDCTEQAVGEILPKLEVQGGSLEPENYILYMDKKVDYTCYTEDYYKTCIMQKPFLKQNIEQEISSYIEPRVRSCFNNIEGQLERSGSVVSVKDIKVETALVPNSVVVTIRAPTTIKRESAIKYDNFRTDVDSEIYDLVMLAASISNYEARYGDSDTLTYMMYYPDIKVEKIERDLGRVYILTHKPSNEKFMFASRSIAWPAGYLGVEDELL
jgi:hypothetical protein